jgi:hypothetical protein
MAFSAYFPDIHIPEIVQQIVQYLDHASLDDVRCLVSCLSVSQTFRYFARKRSYETLHLYAATGMDGTQCLGSANVEKRHTVEELHLILSRHKDVVSFVRHLRLSVVYPVDDDLAAKIDNLSEIICGFRRLECISVDLIGRYTNCPYSTQSMITKLVSDIHFKQLRWSCVDPDVFALSLQLVDPKILNFNLTDLSIEVINGQAHHSFKNLAFILRETSSTLKNLKIGWHPVSLGCPDQGKWSS